jgi:hypothetical protein
VPAKFFLAERSIEDLRDFRLNDTRTGRLVRVHRRAAADAAARPNRGEERQWSKLERARRRVEVRETTAAEGSWRAKLLSLFQCSGEIVAWACEVQRRDRESLFGEALFEKLQFNLGQLGFEKILIAINIPHMSMQTGDSFVHNHPR